MSTAAALLGALLAPPPAPRPGIEPLGAAVTIASTGAASEPPSLVGAFDRAVLAGFLSTSLGPAFARGYHEALHALVPELEPNAIAAFCATEGGSAHPRAMRTRLERAPRERPGQRDDDDDDDDDDGAWLLTGEKSFVTMGSRAEVLVVIAVAEVRGDGPPVLRAALVDPKSRGVTLEPLPAIAFVPEVPHAKVNFAGVPVARERVLEADAYARYVKPFRTVEDAFVHASVLGFVIGVGRRSGFAEAALEPLVALALALREIAALDASAPETHVALAGVLNLAERALESAEPEWAKAAVETREAWLRDRPLLRVASRARAARREKAWERLRPA